MEPRRPLTDPHAQTRTTAPPGGRRPEFEEQETFKIKEFKLFYKYKKLNSEETKQITLEIVLYCYFCLVWYSFFDLH